jgi:FtsP/CotA-like multicopper oxidase with cupredoxin domain
VSGGAAQGLSRRAVVAGAVAGLAGWGWPRHGGSAAERTGPTPIAAPRDPVTHDIAFLARERPTRILGADGPTVPLWSYAETPFPILRARVGDRIRATLENGLAEHTSIHWHGIRLPNAMDGVQHVTQSPVGPGERFTYDFTVPDTGSFFFHPHCNESGQVGHGLAGLLIVEGDERRRPDAELVLAVKDWRLDEAGRFLPFVTAAGASRAGSFGTVRSVNGKRRESFEAPAGALVRVRLYNLDATRVLDVGATGGPAAVIAADGTRIDPVPLDRTGRETWRLGPGMRADILLRMPAAGRTVELVDYRGAELWTIATLTAVKSGTPPRRFDPDILLPARYPAPDLGKAERLPFVFQAASASIAAFEAEFPPGDPLAAMLLDSLCVGGEAYWSINKSSWPTGDHRALPPPLAELVTGKSYVFELTNATPHPHPVHLHGHIFRVVASSSAEQPLVAGDTVLLGPRDRTEIAFVAAPGAWMLHCHVLEHLETGMMGWLRVA